MNNNYLSNQGRILEIAKQMVDAAKSFSELNDNDKNITLIVALGYYNNFNNKY